MEFIFWDEDDEDLQLSSRDVTILTGFIFDKAE